MIRCKVQKCLSKVNSFGLCYNHYQQQFRKATNNSSTHKYEKTKNGFLMRTYRNMLSRVTGIQVKKAHLYKGLSILSRKDFYDWALENEEFNKLFQQWIDLDYDRRLCPSIDRIDSTLGYDLTNVQWLTHSENSRKGALSR